MVHEGGHAIHSFLSRELKLTEFKSTPSEVAESCLYEYGIIIYETLGRILF